jgi:predicted ABC-class ATPase
MSYRGGRGGGRGDGRGGGRGEYYKNKYGGGGRGRGRGNEEGGSDRVRVFVPTGGGSFNELKNLLQRLDGKQYPCYHDIDTPLNRGWNYPQFTLFCEKAQSDPFAAPTRCRIVIDAAHAGFPRNLYSNRTRSIALGDYLLRVLHGACKRLGADTSMSGSGGGGWSGNKGGDIQVLEPCQSILEQSAVFIDPTNGNIVAQITINLPARGRSILGHAAETIFSQTLPSMIERMYYTSLSADRLKNHIEMIEDQVWLQEQLKCRNIVSFIRNGAILPRKSGADDRPMDGNPVPFKSPSRLEIDFILPNSKTKITGMGIPLGITLICGGGFHGKSTLLQTVTLGLYPKIPGDGREFCMTSVDACKVRAEDGRNVTAVDISNFINNLPFGRDTTCFSTEDASGSTSQATNIIEAIECGANALLIDEGMMTLTNATCSSSVA